MTSLLSAFAAVTHSGDAIRNAVECGAEKWTYAELDAVSTGLALDMYKKVGLKPVVAIVSENHPYVLATILATWKLGGVVAPLDHNVPRDIMERMLLNIRPTFVLAASGLQGIQKLVIDMSLLCLSFDATANTITSLTRKYINQISTNEFPLPDPSDIALYLHTSSASSVSNTKCVPLTHESILAGSQARLQFWKRTWPEQQFEHLRILGWSPWSHVIGLSHDLGAAMFLTAGCYIFGIPPSTYDGPSAQANKASRYMDVCGQLLETAMANKPTTFAGVPWVLEGFMRTYQEEQDSSRKETMLLTLKAFKTFGSGGAATTPECVEWAKKHMIPLIFDLGMTELGGPLFHSTVNEREGWDIKDTLLSDAILTLIDEAGSSVDTEGELVVRSRFITKGYLLYDNAPFTAEDDGTISFRTGDIYGYVGNQRLSWKGRKEDYIQMVSGENIDPRIVEAILDQAPGIARACVVGNNFLKASSQVVCAIIEPTKNSLLSKDVLQADIMRAFATANRELAPPLRISWGRVLILDGTQEIPITKKGAIFRKKLEDMFGEQLTALLSGRPKDQKFPQSEKKPAPHSDSSQGQTKDQITRIVADIVLQTLGITAETLDNNSEATFAELGMDSAMSTIIVNRINKALDLDLPLNTCHTHVDLVQLNKAILSKLGIDGPASKVRTTFKESSIACEMEQIVIVGQAVRLPGEIDSPESFWKTLMEQRDVITPVPASRWDHASFYRPPGSEEPPNPGDICLEKAGFVEYESFDHAFFGISSAEAFHVSPSIRLSLEVAFEALEDANITPSKIKGSSMGVFIAIAMDEGYIKLLLADKGWGAYSRFWGTGTAPSTACGRLSYLLDIHGPSVTVDTACSSGLVAFDQAVQYLRSGEGESAIVCGANTHAWPGAFAFLSAQKMTSVNSRCATFTNMADGYVPSEAAAGLILKTKSAALRDGDRIIGVVRSTDVKHDGRSQGLVAPNVKAQIAMQISLLEKAGLSPSDIDFIECHGTGTSLGDLIEIDGINEVFEYSHTPERPLVLGAGKTCVGHGELVAGLIGVLKALGSFKDNEMPGLVQLTKTNMNPSLDCSLVPLQIPDESIVIKTDGLTPVRGLVLSNGFAGSIAGTILEAPSEDMKHYSTPIPTNIPMMFVVSAKTSAALTQYLDKYLDFCLNAPESIFHSICYTTCVGREHYRYRFACVVHNMQELISRIEERLQNNGSIPDANAKRILLGFPGQGSQYQGMARSLAHLYSGFRAIITEAADEASKLMGYAILPFLVDESVSGQISIDHSEVAPVCIFIFQYAIASWLESLGIHAYGVMGHSLGEIAGAVLARALSFETGLRFAITRATLLRKDPANPSGMLAIAAPEERVSRYIQNLGISDIVAIAVYNGEDSLVVSGQIKAIDELMVAAKRDGLRATKLNVDQGFHSPSIAPAMSALSSWLDEYSGLFSTLEKPFFSTLLGREIPKFQKLDSQYWVDHARNPVRFVQTARVAHKSPFIDVIVDVGPQPTIWSNLQAPEFSGKPKLALTGKRGKNQIVAILAAFSTLFEKGIAIDFETLFGQMQYKFYKTDIPKYPFQRIHNYPKFIPSRTAIIGVASTPPQKVIPTSAGPEVPSFIVDQALCDFLDLHRIEGRRVLPGAAMVDFFARAAKSKSVKNIRFQAPLILETPETQCHVEIDVNGSYKLVLLDNSKTTICSGLINDKPADYLPKTVAAKAPETVPLQMMSKAQVYECFKNVQFGEPFRTVHEVRIWHDHADADIRIEPTDNAAHDRIRKIDACLHMFGAVSSKVAPETDDQAGAFLPASIEDFTLHSIDLPYNFTCRYYLPLEIGRGGRSLASSFAVFSETGALLISCKKYLVAWVPRGAVHREQEAVTPSKTWFQIGWTAKELPRENIPVHHFKQLVYLGNGSGSSVLTVLASSATDVLSIQLPGLSPEDSSHVDENIKCVPHDELGTLASILHGEDILVVLDLTKADAQPGTDEFANVYLQVLIFLQLLLSSNIRVNILALTSLASPVDLYKQGLDLFSDSKTSPMSLLGSTVHGMLQAFRSETQEDNIWCLDLPDQKQFDMSRLKAILSAEIGARYTRSVTETYITYRQNVSSGTLRRFVPSLEEVKQVPSRSPAGTTIIVGFGSLECALAGGLIQAGCDIVVFFGCRPESDPEVHRVLGSLLERHKHHVAYHQVDVGDADSLNKSIRNVMSKGALRNIIYCSNFSNSGDHTLSSVKPRTFDEGFRSNIIGPWNLHTATQELKLNLDSFVLCNGIGAIFGIAEKSIETATNFFMNLLATYRHNTGLAATSLQIGSLESRDEDRFTRLIKMDEGVSSIIKAMVLPIPVQVIANFDCTKFSDTSVHARDPFFANLISLVTTSQQPTFRNNKLTVDELSDSLVQNLRNALELQPNEKLELAEPLTSCGADSITFAQFKGRVLQDFKVDVPAEFLSEEFTIKDMIAHVIEAYSSA